MRLFSRTVSKLAALSALVALVAGEGALVASALGANQADEPGKFSVTFVDETGNTSKTEAVSGFNLKTDATASGNEDEGSGDTSGSGDASGSGEAEPLPADDPNSGAGGNAGTGTDTSAPVTNGAPQWENHTFMRAFIGDPKDTKKQLQITGARLEGDKVVVTPYTELEADKQTTLFYPVTDSDKIYLQYFANAQFAQITYNDKSNGEVVVSGEEKVGLTNNQGTLVFTVSAKRDLDITVTPASGDPSELSRKDYSTPERSVIQYTYKVTQNTTFDLSTSEKSGTQHTISFLTQKKSDWAHNDVSASAPRCKWNNGAPFQHCNHIYKVNNKEIAVDSGTQTETVNDKSTLEFMVYHDRDHFSTEAINTQLAGVYVGGLIFPAPQPLSRYGQSMYETHRSWIDAPTYNKIAGNEGQAHSYAFEKDNDHKIKWLVPVFAKSQGYDAFWTWQTNKTEFQKWYQNAIGQRVIGAKTRRVVKSGPLAGSTITIEVVDAKPMMYTGELGSNPSENDFSKYQDNDSNKYAARGNTLRLAYKVKIENIRSNLTIDTEWSRSNSVKVGAYLNRGVEDLEVWASQANYTSNVAAGKKWISTGSNGAWFDMRTLEGSEAIVNWNPSWQPVKNDDPKFKFQATLQNGYTEPRYRDGTWHSGHMGEYLLTQKGSFANYNGEFFDPNLPVNTNGEKISGEFPLFASTQFEIYRNGWGSGAAVFIGGMNIVGLTSTPAKVTGSFDLNGGMAPSGTSALFPDEATAKSKPYFTYDVESNRVIRIPIQRPTKDGKPLVSWELHRVGPAVSTATTGTSRSAAGGSDRVAAEATNATDRAVAEGSSLAANAASDGTNAYLAATEDRAATAVAAADSSSSTSAASADTLVGHYLPGEQLDLTDTAKMGSRITSPTGDVLIERFYFKANYERSGEFASHSRTIELKSGDKTLRSSSFSAITGANATISEEAVPEVLTEGGTLYVRKLSKRDLTDKLTSAVSEDAATFTFEYDEALDIIPVPDTEPEIQKPEGYVTVTFQAGEHGKISGVTKYYVKQSAGKKIGDLNKPRTAADSGYKFDTWQPGDETLIDQDRTVTASFVLEQPIIPKSDDVATPPEGYVTVTFTVDSDRGEFGKEDVSVYFVNKTAGVKVSALTKPSVTPKTGFRWQNHWKLDGADLDENKVITEDLTIAASLDTWPDIDSENHPGYVKITFSPGEHGKFAEDAQVDFYVNPNAKVKFSQVKDKPVAQPNVGYAFDKWSAVVGGEPASDAASNIELTDDTVLDQPMTITATYTKHDDVIEAKDPDGKDKPAGYATVEFLPGKHGSFPEGSVTKYYVNPQAGILFENLKEPQVKALDGFQFTHWVSSLAGGAGLGGNEAITADLEVSAQYEALPNVIPVPDGEEVPKPSGYVTVTFAPGEHGQLEGTTKYYVNPKAGVLVSNVPAPEVLPNTGFVFWHWSAGTQTLSDNLVIDQDLTAEAQYRPLDSIIPVTPDEGGNLPVKPDGYVTVVFEPGEHGQLEAGKVSQFYVNPVAKVTFSTLSQQAPGVKPETGWVFANWRLGTAVASPSLILDQDLTFTAGYTSLEDVIELGEGKEPPAGYVKVTFQVDPAKAESKGALIWAVNPEKNIALSAVPHPLVSPKVSYVHTGWDQAEDTIVKQDLVVSATFEQLDRIIPASEATPVAPNGYVTVTFVVDPGKGTVGKDATLIYFVDPTREVTLGEIVKPQVQGLGNYRFTGWDKADSLRITEDQTVTALFELSDAGKYEPEGQPIQVEEGTKPKAEDGIANRGELPEETQYSFEEEPPQEVGTHTVTVVVTYPDESEDEVEVELIIVKKDQQPAPPSHTPKPGPATPASILYPPQPKDGELAKTGSAALWAYSAMLSSLLAGLVLVLRRRKRG